ncbi:hypothetical protein TNCV_3310821 [Trichonephila clavipes]|nr:hypothetical protein TNCV_3310821 [Trichonephila clavipes]
MVSLPRSNTSHPSKTHVMQNHFSLEVDWITIQLLVLATLHAVNFESGDWQGNSLSLFIGHLDKERSKIAARTSIDDHVVNTHLSIIVVCTKITPGTQAINPSMIWSVLLCVPIGWALKTLFSDAVFVHSDNVTCSFNSLYFDEVNNVRFFMIDRARNLIFFTTFHFPEFSQK